MVLRIFFTADDLARTTVAGSADPLWETVISRMRLRDVHQSLELHPWLRRVRADPANVTRMRQGALLLSVLAPRGPYIPDFLTPDEARTGLDSGLDALLRTPRRRLRHELRLLARDTRLPDWVRDIADGDVEALNRLANGLRSYHDAAIAPHDDLVTASVAADRARRAHGLLDNGIEGLFDGMRPLVRWQSPVLEVNYPVDQELHLAGRGLRLVPSYFCDRYPISLADPDLAPVLIYPIDMGSRWPQIAVANGPRPLSALMGATRAGVLRALDVDFGTTTTQLARRLHTTIASASRHTRVLRDAGLIATQRDGIAVLHTRTSLGTALLEHDR
ncbi:MAG TPA: helix-turn-helix domain-containing protein [Pseudonocardiaceae bacterium]|nr:helix-turn-helix domain-containing protein [Pseudonocardiaceae bacterium]